MADFNALTGFKGAFDDFDEAVYRVAGLLPGESCLIGYGPNDIGFCEGHDANYLKNWRYDWFADADAGKNPPWPFLYNKLGFIKQPFF